MRFLAYESCDFAVVRALRAVGHDVAAIAEIPARATDEVVMELAIREGRILLTEDKDFGQLVQANQAAMGGVFLLRFPARARADLPAAVVKLVKQCGGTPGAIRDPPAGSGPDQSPSGRLSGTARKRLPNEDPFCTTSLGDFEQRDAMGNSGVATHIRHPGNHGEIK